MTKDEIDAILAGIELPPDITDGQRLIAAETVMRVANATPARGGDRVAVLRDLGWTHGVCYTLKQISTIAVWAVLGKSEEMWAKMPRRGRPRGTMKVKEDV